MYKCQNIFNYHFYFLAEIDKCILSRFVPILLKYEMLTMNVRVLMFGWEFPPFTSGGLGTACYGLTKGLARNNAEVIFVLPVMPGSIENEHVKILTPENYGLDRRRVKFRAIPSNIKPYITSISLRNVEEKFGLGAINPEEFAIYSGNLAEEVRKYARYAEIIAREEEFDIIHCHDWMTYPAGIVAKNIARRLGKDAPLIVHVHATEIDRTAGNPNPFVYGIEKKGMKEADLIITVSNYTKDIVIRNYGIDPEKIHVVHNSIDYFEFESEKLIEDYPIKKYRKIVLFLGRMTIQKGPDHFLRVAKMVSEIEPDAIFVMGGSGDMFPYIVEEATRLGIGDRVLFTDFLSGDDLKRIYRIADVYVMTSVSEPFGITALEAIANGTPIIITKQSGVSEVIRNCLIADFWDIEMIANYIVAVLRYKELRNCLRNGALEEIRNFSWDIPARKCLSIYNDALSIYGK
ncbi:MAG: glycosyltransferase family 1 protein [Candidatus Altiarchaeales archaeon]|nr:MAG: glycosyltransferase family 1 protein [Candidatus Altiarchaeales archaeon]HDO82595.1 glycosyltransferase family 1 protein [Candidatus Altiarchaeales archaeon]HEX55244.1 glycosyltransferase family 1 protein [Candidatus Altiarchaeales archaeon]